MMWIFAHHIMGEFMYFILQLPCSMHQVTSMDHQRTLPLTITTLSFLHTFPLPYLLRASNFCVFFILLTVCLFFIFFIESIYSSTKYRIYKLH